MSDEWRSDLLDLGAYLDRVQEEAGDPIGETLWRLHRAHVAHVPFENLDLVLGRGVAVDLDAVQDKLVVRRRGGYCYEHAVLFGAVLERLGFEVDRLLARIGYDREHPRPRTHMVLKVAGRDGAWLADVGFGSGMLSPLPWAGDAQEDGGWGYRLTGADAEGVRQLQERKGPAGGWTPAHSFSGQRQHASDVRMANHFTATHPSSPFVGRVVVMRRGDGWRTRLVGRSLQVEWADRPLEAREMVDDELVAVLRDDFGIALTRAEEEALTRPGSNRDRDTDRNGVSDGT